jgi:ATP-binding cassette subfamily C protein PrsD
MLQRVNLAPPSAPTGSAWVGASIGMLVATSVVSNLLMLVGPVFMLQVYDRILPSRSLPSLAALSLLVVALYGFYAVIELIRQRIASRLGRRLDEVLMPGIVSALLEAPAVGRGNLFADADAIRAFTSGPGPTVLLDLPWLPIYLGFVYLMHPLLGQVTTAGLVLTVLLLVMHEFGARGPSAAVAQAVEKRSATVNEIRSGTEAIRAMGMQAPLASRLSQTVGELGNAQSNASDRAALYSSFTRGARLMLQSSVLAVGAYLVIVGESTAGVIIAASILSSRAAAPVEQAVSHWRAFVSARQAYTRLRPILAKTSKAQRQVLLPAPSQRLQVLDLTLAAPGDTRPIVAGVSFELLAGDALGIIGASGSGKSSLGRALVGVWQATRGEVRLDGQLIGHYDPSILGAAVGYLPQEVGLLAGTVAENISRLQDGASDAIQLAARAADVQQLIASLPEGYETRIGDRGTALSAGQRQRIGLARALFGEPFLLVLDEPNSNLDVPGEAALSAAILNARARGAIVVVIAHRASALAGVNKLLLVADGRQALFGPREEVLRKIAAASPSANDRKGGRNVAAQ